MLSSSEFLTLIVQRTVVYVQYSTLVQSEIIIIIFLFSLHEHFKKYPKGMDYPFQIVTLALQMRKKRNTRGSSRRWVKPTECYLMPRSGRATTTDTTWKTWMAMVMASVVPASTRTTSFRRSSVPADPGVCLECTNSSSISPLARAEACPADSPSSLDSRPLTLLLLQIRCFNYLLVTAHKGSESIYHCTDTLRYLQMY